MIRPVAAPPRKAKCPTRQESDFTSEGAPPPEEMTASVLVAGAKDARALSGVRMTVSGSRVDQLPGTDRASTEGQLSDELHTKLTSEIARRRALELALMDARIALEQAQAELAGTQAEERRARHLAMHDSLTALPNRGFFCQHLQHALARVEPQRSGFAVLFMDLDSFKPVNDGYGHDVGDELLRIVAARLACAVRAEDMMSRLGGDEFACLLADSPNREQLICVASKLVHAVSDPVKICSQTLTVRLSIGIAVYPADGVTAEALLKSADAAMYRAKRLQTGYAFFARDVNRDHASAERDRQSPSAQPQPHRQAASI